MNPNLSRPFLKAATVPVLALAALASSPLRAQPTLAPPACQCSAPTAVPALSITVVHCLCGGISCVISDITGGTKTGSPLMQCVK